MFNKRIFLLVSAAMLLTACGGNPEGPAGESSGKGDSAPAAYSVDISTIPVADGKETFFFVMEDHIGSEEDDTETVTVDGLPAYVSPFITGAFNGWETTVAKGCVEMHRIEGTPVFYAQWEGTVGDDLGYQICLGHNANSGYGPKKQGILDWSMKATFNSDDNFPYPGNPSLVKLADHLYQAAITIEGEHWAFPKCPKEVHPVTNQYAKFKVDMPEGMELGENLEFVVKGTFSDGETWSIGAPDEEGNYKFLVGESISADTYELEIGIRNKIIGDPLEEQYRLYLKTGGAGVLGGKYKETKDEDQNVTSVSIGKIKFNILSTATDGKIHNIGTLAFPAKVNTYGDDGKVNGTKDFELPVNAVSYLEQDIHIHVKHTGETAIDATVIPNLVGELNPNEEGATWAKFDPLTVVEPGKEWTIDAGNGLVVGKRYGFKFAESGWAKQLAAADGDNFFIRIDAAKTDIYIEANMADYVGGVAKATSFIYGVPANLVEAE